MKNFLKNNTKSIIFYTALFLFITVVSFQANLADYDLFARLLQGQAFWHLGNIMHEDIFSYTPTHTWYDHEWGSSVVFYGIYAKFGAIGLLWLKSLMIFGIFFFVIQALKVSGTKYTTPYNFLFFFFAYHAAAQAGYSNTIRCQLFTYLFFAIWLYLLERVRVKREYYWLATFVPMMLFWANTHGGCAAGFGLLLIYAIGEALNKKPFKYYIITLAVCALVTFANPWGIEYVKFLLNAATMPRPLIGEWQSTFGAFNKGGFLLFKGFFFVMTAVIIIRLFMKRKSLKNLNITKALMLAAMTYLSLRYTRHQPFFVLTAIVFLYDDFYRIFNSVVSKLFKQNSKLVLAKEIIVYGFVVISALGYFSFQRPKIVINNYAYPVKAVEFVRINNLAGNLLINFQYGSYAAYKLFPANKIAMDGRYEEVYPEYMLPLLNNFFMQATDKPNLLIETFPPEVIIVEHSFPADKALEASKIYKKVYSDEEYSVFVNRKSDKKSYTMPNENPEYYIEHLFDTYVKFARNN